MRVLKVAGAVWIVLTLALAIAGLLTPARVADVAIVLGNKVSSDGTPAPGLEARLERARQCHMQGECHVVFVSGGTGKSGANEGVAMRDWLERNGVPSQAIVVDEAGDDTWSTARNASEFMRTQGLSSAIVVSQYFHLPRAMLAMRAHGVTQVSGGYPKFWTIRDIYSVAREFPAYLWYLSRRAD